MENAAAKILKEPGSHPIKCRYTNLKSALALGLAYLIFLDAS